MEEICGKRFGTTWEERDSRNPTYLFTCVLPKSHSGKHKDGEDIKEDG